MVATFSSRLIAFSSGSPLERMSVGAADLQRLLESIGLKPSKVVNVPRGTLHLKTDCSLVDEETILATPELAQLRLARDYRTLVVPEEERHATNALRINDVVFIRAGCPRTLELLQKHGLKVLPLPVSEIAKIDAGLSCMSLRWFARRPARRLVEGA